MEGVCSRLRSFLLDKDGLERVKTIDELTSPCQHVDCVPVLYDAGICPSTSAVNIEGHCTLGRNLLTDMEVFRTYGEQEADSDTMFGVVASRCKTQGGRAYVRSLLETPLSCPDLLSQRQQSLKGLKWPPSKEAMSALADMQSTEQDFTWLYEKRSDEISDIMEMAYFRTWFTSWLNGNDKAITTHNLYTILASPSIGVLSPIVYFIVPYLVVRFQLGWSISFAQYARITFASAFTSMGTGTVDRLKYVSYLFSLLFYFQGLFNSFEIARSVYKISELLVTRVNSALTFVRSCEVLAGQVWVTDLGKHVFAEDLDAGAVAGANTFDHVQLQPFNLLSNFGSRLAALKTMNLSHYVPLAKMAYHVDAGYALVALVHDPERPYCWSKLTKQTDEVPVSVALTKMYHPCLANPVKNTLSLGGSKNPRNMLLTGPNAGGKSTLIKAVLCNVLLAQTVTVCAAEAAVLTPFAYISSQINVPDCKGKESLFEAEMHRSQEALQALSRFDGRPTLIAMDEIFNSTNPLEGVAGAYAIARRLGTAPNGISIISTHYLYLTRLPRECPSFRNYQMPVKHETSGAIEFPYKLRHGICRQYVAIELLGESGFDLEIIDDALKIKNRILNAHGLKAKT